MLFLKGKCVLSLSGIIHLSKNQLGTVEKNSSTIDPLAGIEPMLCNDSATLLPLSHRGS